jgi:uncharacterized protein YfaP (DUF2135 family)
MHSLSRFLPSLLPVVLAILVAAGGCSSRDDDARQTSPTGPSTADALAGYWQTQSQASEALDQANDLWENFAALAADPSADAEAALVAALDHAAACNVAAQRLTAWRDLEQLILPDGAKAQFTPEARETALTVLAQAAAAAAAGGEGLVIAWRTLGGLAGLREAMADPDGTIPVNGLLAGWLETRLAARDEAVVAAILAGDDHGGLLPLSELAGATPAERVAHYHDLDDHHPVKRQCRAAVPAWDPDERAASLALLERAARGQLRLFAGVGAGGAPLADLPDHLKGAGEPTPPVHAVTLDLRAAGSEAAVSGPAVVLLHRRGQPAAMPRLALLTAVSAQSLLEVPAGTYDILVLADGWARAIGCAIATTDGLTVPLVLNHLLDSPLVLEGIEAPAMGGAGVRFEVKAVAVSTRGDALNYAWQVHGGPVSELLPAGAHCSFKPGAAGEYTVRVTVSDGRGNARSDSTSVTVTPFAVSVFRTDFVHEQIADHRLNPGETDTLQLWVANRGTVDVTGTARLSGRDGLATDVTSGMWSLEAGRQTRWKVPVTIPADWDEPRARFDFAFTADGVTLVQELDYRVDFYVDLDYIRSPVTSRILSVSGVVANPQLATAQLVIDRDRRQVYELALQDGAFDQVVILAGSEQSRRVRLEVSAESGNRRASARAGFMAAITRADFRATLFWNTAGTDVDLWVTDPLGERCYFANPITQSGLRLDIDDRDGYGPENITGEHNLPAGEYLVQVHYWSDHGTGLASECTVLITLREGTPDEQVEAYVQTLTSGQVWTVATVMWDGAKAVLGPPPAGGEITEAPPGLPAK